MKFISLTFFLSLFIFVFSCVTENKDRAFRIYHLVPNIIYTTPDSLMINGSFLKRRNDFFVVKNYDIKNEQHKIKIDSFIVNYITKDSFLITNKNANWSLTFFKYGNGIDENTKHETDTDYTIHNLFSYKKEIASVYFDTRTGYESSNYNITPEKHNTSKRKIISDYFARLNLSLDKRESFTSHLNAKSKNLDTIRVVAKFIKYEEGGEIQEADYLVLKTLQGKVSSDTIKVTYKTIFAPKRLKDNSILTLLEYDLTVGTKDQYHFPEYDGITWSKTIKINDTLK